MESEIAASMGDSETNDNGAEKIPNEIKQLKYSVKKMWMVINKLKGKEKIENGESEMYNTHGIPLKQEDVVD